MGLQQTAPEPAQWAPLDLDGQHAHLSQSSTGSLRAEPPRMGRFPRGPSCPSTPVPLPVPLLGVSLEVTSLTVSLSFTLLRTFLSGHFILDENATSLHYTVSWERNHFQIILRYLLG